MNLDDLGRKYTTAIRTADATEIVQYTMTIDYARKTAPEEMDKLSDSQIKSEFLNPMKERFKKNITGLNEHLAKNGMELSNLNMVSQSTKEIKSDKDTYWVMSVEMADSAFRTSVPLVFMKDENKLYIIEMASSRPHLTAKKMVHKE